MPLGKNFDKLSLAQIIAEIASGRSQDASAMIQAMKMRAGINLNASVALVSQRSEIASGLRVGNAFGARTAVPAIAALLSQFQLFNDTGPQAGVGPLVGPASVLMPYFLTLTVAAAGVYEVTVDQSLAPSFGESLAFGGGEGAVNLLMGANGPNVGASPDDGHTVTGGSALGVGATSGGGPGWSTVGLAVISNSKRIRQIRFAAAGEIDVMFGAGLPLPFILPMRGISIYGPVNTAFTVNVHWLELPI